MISYIIFILLPIWHPHLLVSAQSINARPESNSRFSTLNAGIFVVFFVVLLTVIYYIVSKCFFNQPRQLARGSETVQKAQRGLEPSILEAFPVFKYSEESSHGLGKVSLECAVCLSLFEEDETLRMLPKCKHVFHVDCVNRWLAGHTTCPICRADLAHQPSESARKESECVCESRGSGGGVNEVAHDVV
ncbi:hypothetical protein BVRB_4g094470 [Beta vulgaris subsp. vulgaris]|uniref:RING-type E3 ubiquitin transferase n=1 Tax=Beta vulgaris subsp. vulgaris TaxID=3555 RepID=A0A0J8BBH7_BETVV|nr:hypothetical protein BVRB_4g094470 [Beta vulgaris subsp. vulgaris]